MLPAVVVSRTYWDTKPGADLRLNEVVLITAVDLDRWTFSCSSVSEDGRSLVLPIPFKKWSVRSVTGNVHADRVVERLLRHFDVVAEGDRLPPG